MLESPGGASSPTAATGPVASAQYFEALSSELEEGARVRSKLQKLRDESMRRLQLLRDEKNDVLARLDVAAFEELTISPEKRAARTPKAAARDAPSGVSPAAAPVGGPSPIGAPGGAATSSPPPPPPRTHHPLSGDLGAVSTGSFKTDFLRQKFVETQERDMLPPRALSPVPISSPVRVERDSATKRRPVASGKPSVPSPPPSSTWSSSPLRYTARHQSPQAGDATGAALFDDDIDHATLRIIGPEPAAGALPAGPRPPEHLNFMAGPGAGGAALSPRQPPSRVRGDGALLEYREAAWSGHSTAARGTSSQAQREPPAPDHMPRQSTPQRQYRAQSIAFRSPTVSPTAQVVPAPVFTPGGSLRHFIVRGSVDQQPRTNAPSMNRNHTSVVPPPPPPPHEAYTRSFNFEQPNKRQYEQYRSWHQHASAKGFDSSPSLSSWSSHSDRIEPSRADAHQQWHQSQVWEQRWRPGNSPMDLRHAHREVEVHKAEDAAASAQAQWIEENRELQALFDHVKSNHDRLVKTGSLRGLPTAPFDSPPPPIHYE